MATEISQQVMALLKELSMLKEADTNQEEKPTGSKREERDLRQKRKEEIVEEIKTLASQKKYEAPTSAGADSQRGN
jgi:hypothetical protein